MAKTKSLDYKPTFVKASLVPLVVAPFFLWLMASDNFAGAWQTFYPVILGVWVFSLFMAFVFPRKYRFTRLFSTKGAQLGLLLHLINEYKSFMPIRLVDSVMWSNWIVVLAAVGFLVGWLKDTKKA